MERLRTLTLNIVKNHFVGGSYGERRHRRWFSSVVTGTIEETGKESIEKIWRIEKCLDQLIPVQLPSRRLDKIDPFDQVNLQNICIIRTSRNVKIWYENKETEGSNQTDYQNVIKGAKTIAGKMFKGILTPLFRTHGTFDPVNCFFNGELHTILKLGYLEIDLSL